MFRFSISPLLRASPRLRLTRFLSVATSPRVYVSREVARALESGDPIVALESTIISHGMPFPANLECAIDVESAVKANGATPATVAIIEGRACVGLSHDELEALARAGERVRKCSRRDLAAVVARGGTGATTVAGVPSTCLDCWQLVCPPTPLCKPP